MKKFLMRRLGVADESSGLRPSLQDCIEAVLQQSDTLMDDVLKGLEASLGQNKAKVAQLKQRPIDKAAVERLRSHAAAVRATFGVQLRLAIYHSGAQEEAGQPLVRFADLQLLEEKQIDANIEFALAQQEILLAVDDVLPPLNALVSSLLGWLTVQAHLNPLRPDSFARALRECLTQHVPDEEARSSLITPAAGFLGVSLRQLYKELTDWLRSQGVEPVVPMGSATGGDAASRSKTGNSVSRTLLTLDKLRRLLSGELDSPGHGGFKGFLHTVPASLVALEDMQMVEPMMKRLSQRASLAAGTAGSQGQPVAREKTEGRLLGKQLGEEVVRLMLDNLMQDQRLLPPVRAQVKALEPVLLQLAQVDSRFFSDRRHPARQLLDKLTHRSLRFSSESDEGFHGFLQSIVDAVRDLAAGQGEAETFVRVLAGLEERWSHSEVEQRQRQEGGARALLHAEQRNLLAHRLAADFQERVKDKHIPEPVMVFLYGPWAQVVAESQLRCADGTADADGYLALVDELLWSVQVNLTRRNRTRLVQLVPNLLVKLRQGLQLVQYPQERTAAFFDELITYHESAFETPPALVPAQPPEPAPQQAGADSPAGEPALDDAPDAEAFWVAEDEANEAGYLAEGSVGSPEQAVGGAMLARPWSASDLVTGSWVELQLKGQWVRAQLTWASPHRTLFMFVSGKGEAHSMSRRTMERLRSHGSMRIVSDGHVVDNALDAVAQTALRNDRDPSAGQP